LFPDKFTDFANFQKEAYSFLLYAKSKDLIISERNGVSCTRKKCIRNGNHHNCGFITNYPSVNINEIAMGTSVWKVLNNLEEDFNTFLE
jgi:hypothetical protein